MSKDRIKLALGGVLIVVAVVRLALYSSPRPPFDAGVHEALGRVMAEEALRYAPGGGNLVLIVRDTKSVASPAADAQIRSFCKAVGRSARIGSTNAIKIDPLRVPEVPAGDFWTLMKNAGENDVIVSFMGPPTFSEAQQAKLGGKAAKVVALATGAIARRVDLPILFKRGLLQAAIVDREAASRPNPAASASDSRTIFDSLYTVVSATSMGPKP